MQGLNSNVTVYRATRLADDAAGGARQSAYSAVTSARARIAQRAPTLEMRAQGLSTDNLYDAILQPATVDVRANDLLIPTDGPLAHLRFLVTGVNQPPMDFQTPRAHLRVQLERWDSGKVIELL
jgi:hypothetical protein